jgi:hypothetical protein
LGARGVRSEERGGGERGYGAVLEGRAGVRGQPPEALPVPAGLRTWGAQRSSSGYPGVPQAHPRGTSGEPLGHPRSTPGYPRAPPVYFGYPGVPGRCPQRYRGRERGEEASVTSKGLGLNGVRTCIRTRTHGAHGTPALVLPPPRGCGVMVRTMPRQPVKCN